MNLYSSSSICGNCGKQSRLIVVIDNEEDCDSGKRIMNVD